MIALHYTTHARSFTPYARWCAHVCYTSTRAHNIDYRNRVASFNGPIDQVPIQHRSRIRVNLVARDRAIRMQRKG